MTPTTQSVGTTRRVRNARPSLVSIVWLTIIWVMLWGEFSVRSVLGGLAVAFLVSIVMPMPRAANEKMVVRPIATARLIGVFIWDVVKASAHITVFIITGRKPQAAIIRVHTRAESDIFLMLTSAFTALVPGSIVIESHRLTGMMYVHVFDVSGENGLQAAHDTVLRQEERILRAFGSKQTLIDAGFVPSGSMRAGRLPKHEQANETEEDSGVRAQ